MIEPLSNSSAGNGFAAVKLSEDKAAFLNSAKAEAEKDKIPFSPKVFRKIDRFFDLGSTSTLDLGDLSKEESRQFWKVVSKLLQKGLVGYNYYEIDGKIEKHYVISDLGNQRLAGSKVVTNMIDAYV